MIDIIPLLPIEQPQGNRSSYYIPCPCCDGNKKHNGHLNINLVKDVFRCPRCGFSGGVLDLYSRFSNTNREHARDAIASRILTGGQNGGNVAECNPPVINENPIANIATRDATYKAFLDMLSLASDHKQNLLNRGLSDYDITERGYRTAPVVGWKAIARKLLNEGYYLAGIPGFYRDDDEQWTLVETKRGILIPVRDIQGHIQGLQVRRDYIKRRKFRWVSSRERHDGCGIDGCTHFAGAPCEEILLVEGPMKADIIYHLTGLTSLAVPGVNSLTKLRSTLSILIEYGLKRVMTCFDMDMLKNPYVQNGFTSMLWMLENLGLEYGTYLWDPHYNGLDDYVFKYCMKQIYS